jgi:hypothetical protein
VFFSSDIEHRFKLNKYEGGLSDKVCTLRSNAKQKESRMSTKASNCGKKKERELPDRPLIFSNPG